MNLVFAAIVLIAFVVTAVRELAGAEAAEGSSPMAVLGTGMVDTAESAVTLALGLIGVMSLFLGLMKVAETAGLLRVIARVLRPLMVRLFPEVPPEHPAMGAIIMNLAANALGLGNAATPFGIRAMQELDRLNPHKGTATDAMALFLAINTSAVTLLPTGVIALRAAAGSSNPAGIVPTTLVATIASTAIAITSCKLLQRRFAVPAADDAAGHEATTSPRMPETESEPADTELPAMPERGYPLGVSLLVLAGLAAVVPLMLVFGRSIAPWIIPGLFVGLLGFGLWRRVRIYEVFVEGARDGFNVAVRILPYLVAILVAVGMLRDSGALGYIVAALGAVTAPLGLPGEALPMALLRPLSGSGAYGVLASIIQDPAVGPDSYTGYLVSTLQGSTETTFYVIAVYFGAVQVRRVRHALPCALLADAGAVAAAVAICLALYGSGA